MADDLLHQAELLPGVVEAALDQQVLARLRRAFISTSGTGALMATAMSRPRWFQSMARTTSPSSP